MKKALTKTPRWLRLLLLILFFLFYTVFALWCVGAIFYSPIPSTCWRIVLIVLFLCAVLVALLLRWKRYSIPAAVLLMLIVCIAWEQIRPSNQRDWAPEYARTPYFEYVNPTHPDEVRIYDIRDFRYRSESEFEQNYRTEDYRMEEIVSLDYVVVHWGGMEAIAHTMLSFGFKDGRHLVFSVETRRDVDDEYGALPGLFKRFELICIIGTERDLLELRTNHRHEDVYLYPTNATPEQRQAIFMSLLNRCNYLHANPEFYNTLTFNCMKSLIPSIREGVDIPLRHITYIFNGFSDRLAYRLNFLRLSRPDQTFEELKEESYVNPLVDQIPDPVNYSSLIRPKKGTRQ